MFTAYSKAKPSIINARKMVGSTRAAPSDPAYKSPWLHAHYDKLAGIRAHSGGVALVDLDGSGEGALVIADYARKVRVFRGLKQVNEVPLPPTSEKPSAICCFYMEEKKPCIPVVAVASGPHVFVFRNLRPYCKYTAPRVELEAGEADVWRQVETMEPTEMRNALKSAHASGTKLSTRSLAMLPMQDQDQLRAHVQRFSNVPPSIDTVITCMVSMPKSSEEPDAVSTLVIGTESRKVIILEPSCKHMLCEVELPSVPTTMCVGGCYDVDWRIIVACRDARVYTIAVGEHRGTAVLRRSPIELDAQLVAIIRNDKYLYLATADCQLHCYLHKGRKVYSMAMPAPITNLELLLVRKMRQVAVLLVALSNGEIRGYREKDLVDIIRVNEVVTALTTGTYGREDSTLIIVTLSGSLLIKMLPRTTSFDGAEKHCGPPSEQDIPLDIPKKTRLYFEQTERERDKAPEIYRTFQKDSLKLRITTAKAYLQLHQIGEMVQASIAAHATVNLSAHVSGLGEFVSHVPAAVVLVSTLRSLLSCHR